MLALKTCPRIPCQWKRMGMIYLQPSAYVKKNSGELGQTARWNPYYYEGHRPDVPTRSRWGDGTE